MRTPLIIDTDGGIDDVTALWWACTSSAVDLLAVTTVFGNVPVDVATANVHHVLHLAGRDDVRVGIGAQRPSGPTPITQRTHDIHGLDGLGDFGITRYEPLVAPSRAGDLLNEVVTRNSGQVTIVTLGPVTNIAEQVRGDHTWPQRVRRLVTMGGCVTSHGNVLPICEANVASDPNAASVVMGRLDWLTPPLLVGLDVTHKATLTQAQFDVLAAANTPQANFLGRLLVSYAKTASQRTWSGECPCHDLVAVQAAVDQELVQSRLLPISVQTVGGPAWGATVVDRRSLAPLPATDSLPPRVPDGYALWDIALDVDVERFRAKFDSFMVAQEPNNSHKENFLDKPTSS